MAKNVKKSMALKGNKNAAGSRGGATAGTIGGLFGPVGSFAGGFIAGMHAKSTYNTPNRANGERVIKRARRASATVGGIGGAAAGATKGFLKGAAMLSSEPETAAMMAGGAIVGGAIAGGISYAASRAGARLAGSGKSKYKKVPVLKHARHQN
jgi:hypothetical protein